MADSISFLGYNVLPEVKRAIPLLQKIGPDNLEPILELVLIHLSGDDIEEVQFDSSQRQSGLERPVAAALFTGVFYILRKALRDRVKSPDFNAALEELRVPAPIINVLWKAFHSRSLFLLLCFYCSWVLTL